MNQTSRKLALTTHIALSVGWIGAVLAYLTLVVAAMVSDPSVLRAAWIGMELIGWYLIVPLAFGSLLTGIIMSAGTKWGLLKHYWVVASLVLTALATAILVAHMPTVTSFARLAVAPRDTDLALLRAGLRGELLHAGVGLMVLLAIEGLNIYKPLGITPFGARAAIVPFANAPAAPDATMRLAASTAQALPFWIKAVGAHAAALLLFLVAFHLAGGRIQPH